MIISKQIKKIHRIAEKNGWSVNQENNDEKIFFTFSQTSPAGQDFSFTCIVSNDSFLFESLSYAVYEYWKGFDVSQETYFWLDESGHGKNGAPYDMMAVYNDMEACAKMIRDLWYALEES